MAEQEPAEDEQSSSENRPEGWTEASHGKDAKPDYDRVFAQGKVMRLDVTISPENWKAMLDDMAEMYGVFGHGGGIAHGGPKAPGTAPGPGLGSDRNPIWVPVTITFAGKTWNHVGLRFKGLSSLQMSWSEGIYKLPFRLDFDQFEDEHPEVDDQRFFGFKCLSLASNWGDSSLLREKVTADILRAAGVPAARTAFYRLYVDVGQGPTYYGLYTLTEIPGKPMLSAQFGDDGGNLYKPEGLGANLLTFDEQSFDKETNKSEGDYSDVIALIDVLNADRSDAASWRADLENAIDAEGFLLWVAANTVVQNWDVYGNIAHNYYLYGDAQRLHWIPWDHNAALRGGDKALSLGLEEVDHRWPLIRLLIDDTRYRAIYRSHIEGFIDDAFDEQLVHRQLEAEHALIKPFVVGEDGEQPGYTHLRRPGDFDQEIGRLLEHVTGRQVAAREFLADSQWLEGAPTQ